MMFSLRKNSDRGGVGLDIDGRYLAAAQVDGGRVVRGASQELPDGLVRDGEVVDPDGLADALKSLRAPRPGCRRRSGSESRTSRSWFAWSSCPASRTRSSATLAVRFQAAEAIAMPLDEAVLDHQVAGYTTAPDGSPAHAGGPRGRPPHDDRGLLDAAQGRRAQARRASTSMPSRWSACSPSTRTGPTTTRGSSATSAG